MKSVELADATMALAEYARAGRETLVVTRRGKPVAAVVPIRGVDMETLSLFTNPDFMAMIEQSRASYRASGGISLEELRLKHGLTRKPRRKAARTTPARRASSR